MRICAAYIKGLFRSFYLFLENNARIEIKRVNERAFRSLFPFFSPFRFYIYFSFMLYSVCSSVFVMNELRD